MVDVTVASVVVDAVMVVSCCATTLELETNARTLRASRAMWKRRKPTRFNPAQPELNDFRYCGSVWFCRTMFHRC